MTNIDTLTTTIYVSPSFTVEERKQSDLKKYIEMHRESAPSMGDRLRMCLDMYTGISIVHGHKLAHLDIKPENIFVSNRSLSIGDFGFLIRCTNDSKKAVGRSFGWSPHSTYSGKLCQLVDLYSTALVTIGILAWNEDIINQCRDFSDAFNRVKSREELCKVLEGVFDKTISYNSHFFPETVNENLIDKLKRSIIGLECGSRKRITASIAASTIEKILREMREI